MPGRLEGLAEPTLGRRIRAGVRISSNWLQLLRFALVGASGYVVNLATFAILVGALGTGHRIGAVGAFVVAVANNFLLNRAWTFVGSVGRAHRQAVRFLLVSVGAFCVSFLVLELLVTVIGVPEVPAQAVAVVVATPFNFLGNRLWTFSA